MPVVVSSQANIRIRFTVHLGHREERRPGTGGSQPERRPLKSAPWARAALTRQNVRRKSESNPNL
jgi:hypothetical protein